MRVSCVLALVSLLATPSDGKRLLELLIAAPRLVDYVDDGAGDGSVMAEYLEGEQRVRPVKEGFAVAELGDAAIPLLIDCLDDTRPTKATFRAKPVSAGFVCLDVLLHAAADHPALFVQECADDGMGACVQKGFYFRPDSSRSVVQTVQKNWRKAYADGLVKSRFR